MADTPFIPGPSPEESADSQAGFSGTTEAEELRKETQQAGIPADYQPASAPPLPEGETPLGSTAIATPDTAAPLGPIAAAVAGPSTNLFIPVTETSPADGGIGGDAVPLAGAAAPTPLGVQPLDLAVAAGIAATAPAVSPQAEPSAAEPTAPTDGSTEPPTESPTQPPTEPPTESPTEPPTETPTESPTAPPTDSPTEPPTQPPTEPPTESPTEPPTEPPTQPPTDEPTQAPTEPPTLPPTEPPTELPTQPPTESPTDSPTEPPTQPPTVSPTEPPTEPPTLPPTDEPTQPPTETPTETPTDQPTLPPTEPPTEPPTDPPTLPPTDGRWFIHQTPQAGDRTSDDTIVEEGQGSNAGTTTFGVHFDSGHFELANGEVIRVFLDIDPSSTASPPDWSWQVEPVQGLELVGAEIADGQLVATLQVDQAQGLNLTGKVLDVRITATPDQVPEEGGETLLFDINDERPAEFVETRQIIGQTWEDKDDYLITILDETVHGGSPQAMASLEAAGPDSLAPESIDPASPAVVADLASGFLEAVGNGNGPPLAVDSGPGAWAHQLDQMVAHYLETNSLDAEQFAVVQQGVLNQVADRLDGDGQSIGRDGDGNADYPDVLAALGSHGPERGDASPQDGEHGALGGAASWQAEPGIGVGPEGQGDGGGFDRGGLDAAGGSLDDPSGGGSGAGGGSD